MIYFYITFFLDFELDAEGENAPGGARVVKKNIAIKLKSTGKPQRGRPRKATTKTTPVRGKKDDGLDKMDQTPGIYIFPVL